MKELRIPALVESLDCVQNFIKDSMVSFTVSDKVLLEIDIAVEEIFVNIASYAYAPDIGAVTIKCKIIYEEDAVLEVSFVDEGKPFNPLQKEDADITLSAEERKIGGLGILMVKRMMDKVDYQYEGNKNTLTIWKKLV